MAKKIDPIILPSGAVLTRTVSKHGVIKTHVPAEHVDEYLAWGIQKGIEAGKRLQEKV